MTEPAKLNLNQRIVCAVGAFVLQSQEMEQLLKFVVPMTNESDPSLSAILKRNSVLAKKSLGLVAGDFVKAWSGETEELERYIDQIVAERNEIVHHFSTRFAPLLESGRHDEVLKEIKRRQARAAILVEVLRALALAITEGLRDVTFAGTDEYEEMDKLCTALRTRWAAKPASDGS